MARFQKQKEQTGQRRRDPSNDTVLLTDGKTVYLLLDTIFLPDIARSALRLLGSGLFLFAFAVAILLGKDAAAVILHIHAEFTRLVLSLAEAGREIAVQIGNAVFCGGLLCDLPHQLVVLIRADEQGRGKLIVAVLGGETRRFVKAERIAGRTAVVPVGVNGFDKPAQPVFIFDLQLEVDALCVFHQRVFTHFVLFHRVDVGIVPKTYRLDTLLPQRVDARNGAGRTADMKKCSGQKIKPF